MLRVLKSGIYTSIQDQGRKGYAQYGLPTSGAMDMYSANLANLILGNDLNDAVLEIFFGMSKFEFLEETTIVLTGGDFSAKINNELVSLNTAIRVEQNDILSFARRINGSRTYLAVKNGFSTLEVLGSRSQYQGITPQNKLEKGDELPYHPTASSSRRNAGIKRKTSHFTIDRISVFKGPEYDMLSPEQETLITNQTLSISNDNNRMGYRLNELIPNDFQSMLTSAVIPGTVQLTPSGKLIVLMRDCQVTGGYPRVLQLTEQSINQLAQKITGDSFEFELL